ncbi:sensor histidine kinase [Vibrio sp. RC586]|uniref:sensor histidine kinase n=1 Tax=Vibrio sp. RC586 TaxID=675815 RepID=UPI0001BB7DE8|nr:ATP-binding protein [Vibrio sp. RC586]EEY99405.1 sensor histidine kinase [Vibrio sp. RC586]
MSAEEQYQRIYERERKARLLAEKLLEEKSRALYDKVLELESTLEQLNGAQAQLLQSEKMASVGQLAAGVAHEINNPIGFCLSNLNTLRNYTMTFSQLAELVEQFEPSLRGGDFYQAYTRFAQQQELAFVRDDVLGLVEESASGLNRVKDIVTSLQSVSHSSDGRFVDCSLNECIESALRIVWNQFKYTMMVERQLDDNLPNIKGITAELQQVLMNMFINASHACNVHGELNIITDCVLDKGKTWVRVRIADNGHGISAEHLTKVFDPFFTTKPVGVGTGLGLSIAFGIVEKHQGKISVTSEIGRGTTFTLLFPAVSN